MKISISMKSTFAHERLIATLKKLDEDIVVYKDNIKTIDELDSVIEFNEPDLIILDSKTQEFEQMINFLNVSRGETSVIIFDSDFEQVIEQVKTHLFVEEEVEDEQSQKKEVKHLATQGTTVIEYKEKIVEKEVIRTAFSNVPTKLIVISSLWQGAGSTTLAVNLARAIAERGLEVSYVEFPTLKPYMFDYLSINNKEDQDKVYVDYAQQLKKKVLLRKQKNTWKQNEIDWYVNDSRNEPIKDFSYDEMLNLVYSINSTVTIVDVSSHLHNEEIQKFLHHADDIYVCIEPDIVKLDWMTTIKTGDKPVGQQREEKEVIDYLYHIEEKEGVSFQFVNMKYSKKIDNKVVWAMLRKKPIAFVPVIPYEGMVSSIWKSTFLYDDNEFKETFEKALKPIIVKAVPREFYEIKNNETSVMNKLIGVFKKGERQ